MIYNTFNEIELNNKRVLVRVDLNVPFENGKVSDNSRIDRIIPTIKRIQEHNAQPILLSHFGRPKGKFDSKLSLLKVVPYLASRLNQEVVFSHDIVGPSVLENLGRTKGNKIFLLENIRFEPGEENNDKEFATELAKIGEVFCNDAFSVSHRAHASTVGLPGILPSFAGLLMTEELLALESVLTKPKKPVTAVIGGAKVSTKLTLLKNLIKKVDKIIIGGGMANTFLYAKGFSIGKSLCEKNLKEQAIDILNKASEQNCEIHLPIDLVCAKEFKNNVASSVYAVGQCRDDIMILDSGPKSIKKFKDVLRQSKTIIWNGPLGVFELKPFDHATKVTAKYVAKLTKNNYVTSIAGGGDTVSALSSAKVTDDFTYLSNAGGAFLEWIEGTELPGLIALEKNFKSKTIFGC